MHIIIIVHIHELYPPFPRVFLPCAMRMWCGGERGYSSIDYIMYMHYN